MSQPQLWLVRHGETEWSASGRHTSRTDLPLTEAGEAEATALKGPLEGEAFDLVLASPRRRALETAHLAGFDPEVDDDLVEWDYGDLEGLTTAQIRERYPAWNIWHGPWPGGEKPGQVAARADRVIERVRALPDGGKAIIFAHGHVLRVVTARWLGLTPDYGRLFVLKTATVNVLSWEHDLPAVDRWNVGPGPDGHNGTS